MELFFTIGIKQYLILSAILFTIGIYGLLQSRNNLLNILMSIEIILLSVNINFVAFSSYLNDLSGQIFTIFILTVAAAETAIGLAILIMFYRKFGSIDINDMNQMKE
jgi:NADH-quinone oxidoreductase subunit K